MLLLSFSLYARGCVCEMLQWPYIMRIHDDVVLRVSLTGQFEFDENVTMFR